MPPAPGQSAPSVALPRMLEEIEAELATARPAEKRRLQERAELVRVLIAPAIAPSRSS